jgi:protein subunit release factor A
MIIEIRAAEGGDDAKLLVSDQLMIYARLAIRRGL